MSKEEAISKEEAAEIINDFEDVICMITNLDRENVSITPEGDGGLFPLRFKTDDPVYNLDMVIDGLDSVEPFFNSVILIGIKARFAELKELLRQGWRN